LDGGPQCVRFKRLFELYENCLVMVDEMFDLRWVVIGDGSIF